MLQKEYNSGPYAVLILAAGASTRLGRPKQLLNYNGKTLLSRCLQTSLSSKTQPVIVVLGAHAEKLKEEIDFAGVQVVYNTDWKEGMASSIRCGIQFLKINYGSVEGVILMMCDQPKVTEQVMHNLLIAHEASGKPIIASGYDGTFGPPVFFHSSLFDELLFLKNDVGARSVVRDHSDAVEIVPFPEGAFDIDTEKDFERMRSADHQ